MLSVLASGTLLRDPQERASAAGRRYATGLLKTPTEGEEAPICSLIAFSEFEKRRRASRPAGDDAGTGGPHDH